MKWFGFVRYENPESAQKAIEALDGKVEGEITWYVKIYQPKFNKRRQFAISINTKNRNWSFNNVVIHNLPVTYGENKLKNLGSQIGEVFSCKNLG